MFTNNIIQALCRTLFHSLWQGLLLAVVAGLVVVFTKKLTPAVRYNVLTALLLVFTACIILTFCIQLNAAGTVGNTYNNPATAQEQNIGQQQNETVTPAENANILQAAFAWGNNHASAIVSAWLLIIAFRCLQMLIGLRGVYLLKRRGVFAAGHFWDARFKQLAQNIHVTGRVTLLQSAIAKVPMVIGHFKPIILLPAGILTALPQDEIEAILLHELAHIRRKDYLVNMLQSLCGIIFFFNPAVLWLLSLIKDQRENCCDDIALGEVKNKKQLIHALISFQEYNMALSNYAVGFPGRRNHLLNRVKRIITNNNKSLSNMEKSLLATGIVLIGFVTIAFAQAKQPQAAFKKAATIAERKEPAENKETAEQPPLAKADSAAYNESAAIAGVQEDTTVHSSHFYEDNDGDSSKSTIQTDYDGKEYFIKLVNDKLVELRVDGENIPKEKFADYQSTVDNIIREIKEQHRQARIMRMHADTMRMQARIQSQQMREQARIMRMQSDTMRVRAHMQSEQMREQARMMRIQSDTVRMQARMQSEQIREQARTMRMHSDTMRVQARMQGERMREQSRMMRLQSDTMRVQARMQSEQMREQGRLMRIQADTMRMRGEKMREVARQSRRDAARMMDDVIGNLQEEGVIKDAENISFSLNDNELVVNGVKQSETLHQKLKDKYLQSAGDNISYSRSGDSKNSHISIQKK